MGLYSWRTRRIRTPIRHEHMTMRVWNTLIWIRFCSSMQMNCCFVHKQRRASLHNEIIIDIFTTNSKPVVLRKCVTFACHTLECKYRSAVDASCWAIFMGNRGVYVSWIRAPQGFTNNLTMRSQTDFTNHTGHCMIVRRDLVAL